MIIYKTTNLINDKIYIGQDSRDNPKYLGSGVILLRAIKKYGKDSFKKVTLEKCSSYDELNDKERYWINKLMATNKDIGYNIDEGGKNRALAESTKLLISKANTGRVFTKQHKANISKNHHDVSKENNPMFGKRHTDDSITKIRLAKTGTKASDDTRLLMSKVRKGEGNNNSKLTSGEVVLIRQLYFSSDITQKCLAQRFGVNEPAIYKIVNYLTWKHLG